MMLINKQKIAAKQYFPIYGFAKICSAIGKEKQLKRQQLDMLKNSIANIQKQCKNSHTCITDIKIADIKSDESISNTYKNNAIAWAIWHGSLDLKEVEQYLKDMNLDEKKPTDYRKLLCMFDYKKYGEKI
ncbi:hypothetical protein [Neisseria iguanae]|uniref:hypothetical protein n=1 Tax=Neisseria iguanae TaxID=90242 RepID=UPI003CCB91A4